MKSIYIASLAAIGAVAQTCGGDYGDFREVNGECMFDCEYDGEYVEISTLTFDQIASSCNDVRSAVENGICDKLEDLVYRDDDCRCPYCSCSSESSQYIETISNEPQLECDLCTCGEIPYYYGNMTDLVYDCDYIMSVYEASEYSLFKCPPNECKYNTTYGSQRTIIAGQQYWQDVGDSDTECTTFCYCPGSGDAVCATGWDNIVKTDAMARQLNRDCYYYLESVM